MILEPLRIKLELAAAAIAAAAIGALLVWALAERSGRLACKVELQKSVDQVAVLAGSLERQSGAIEDLAGKTKSAIDRTGRVLDELERRGAGDRAKIARLEAQLAGQTPIRADGTPKGCKDYLDEWRAERGD